MNKKLTSSILMVFLFFTLSVEARSFNEIKKNGETLDSWSDNHEQENKNDKIVFTEKEQLWLKKHRTIRISNELNWPPFNYNVGGTPAGYSIDYINLLASRIGIEVKFVSEEWAELLNQAFNKKLDVMLNIVKTPERQKHLLYTGSYAKNPNVIVALENSSISDIKSLFGKSVAYTEGFFYDEILRTKFPTIKRVPVKNTLASLKALQFGKADAVLGELEALRYQMNENLLTGMVVKGDFQTDNDELVKLNFAVRNDWPELQSLLQKTMLTLTTDELTKLRKKWFGDIKKNVVLTPKEQIWLDNNLKIKVGIEPNWMPLEQINSESGEYEGIIADYLKLITKRSGLNIEVVPTKSWQETIRQVKMHQADAYSGVKLTEGRQKYVNYSKPYLRLNDVIVMQQNAKTIKGLKELRGKRVGVVKDYYVEVILKRDYPELQIISVTNTLEGMKQIVDGKLDAFIDDQLVVGYIISQNAMYSLKIAAKTSFKSNLHIAVRNDWPPEALSIINKAIATITKEDQNHILQQWISFSIGQSKKQEKQIDNNSTSSLETITAEIIVQGLLFILVATTVMGVFVFVIKRYFGNFFTNLLLSNKAIWIGPIMISIFLIVILIITQVALKTIEKQTRTSAANSLQSVVNTTHESLSIWVENKKNAIMRLAQDPNLIDLVQKHLIFYRSKGSILNSNSLKKLREFFDTKRSKHGDIGFFIIAPDNISIASMRDNNIGTTNLIAEQSPVSLQKVFSGETVFILPIRSDVALETESQTSYRKPATMFFAAPVKDELGLVIAVLTLRIDTNRDFKQLIQGGRIGSSDKTYAFDLKGRLISKSRFPDQLRKIGLISENQQEVLNMKISDPGGNLLKGHQPSLSKSEQPLTLMAKSAISGNNGLNIYGYRDYRGVRVLGAWIWDDELGFGLTTEIGEEEVLASYYTTRTIVISVLGMTVFLSILLTAISLWLVQRASKFLIRQLAESEKIASMTRTFEKFVPVQFLRRIAASGIENIELGNAQIENITILFSDIRSFTNLSETMPPKDLLQFLNQYLDRMNNIIHLNNGFIDKFIGDAIMALFDRTINSESVAANDAILAAIAMHQIRIEYNRYREAMNRVPIDIGIGIHTGEVILGTVGSKQRMDSTVLGDNVNLTSRLESLTKIYGVNIIASHNTISLLGNSNPFKFRELDRVKVKGKTEITRIYEIFNCDLPEIQELKAKTAPIITAGLYHRENQQWDDALAAFQKALDIYREDRAIKHHIEYCLLLRENPPSSNWDGAIDLSVDPLKNRLELNRKIEWESSFSIGIEYIDKQHQELIVRLNKLIDATNTGKSKDQVEETLSFLCDYVVTHFQDEEKLMEQSKYPAYSTHKKEHEQFIGVVEYLKNEYETKGIHLDLAFRIQSQVVAWVINHIIKYDKKIGNWLKDNEKESIK
ncbi:bacteriohemerythrin [Candidatus Halobeggiatoa sp. HSG11]|nr:bacteriohemerythrin [Candidatus Halobeggiatoa sp. HSG11]